MTSIKDAVTNGKTGLLCNYGDIDTIAKFSLQMQNNLLLYRKYSQNARERISKHYCLEIMVSGHEIKLQNLIN